MRRRRPGRCLHLGITCVGAAKANVLPRRRGKHHRILRHHGDIFAEIVTAHVAQIHAIQFHRTGGRIIKPFQQLDNG